MKFSKFEIKDFRCFSDKQRLKFALPVAEKEGSGITYIVGQNNAGKTTVLEGIFFKENDKIRSADKRGNGPKFSLYADEGGSETVARAGCKSGYDPCHRKSSRSRFDCQRSRPIE